MGRDAAFGAETPGGANTVIGPSQEPPLLCRHASGHPAASVASRLPEVLLRTASPWRSPPCMVSRCSPTKARHSTLNCTATESTRTGPALNRLWDYRLFLQHRRFATLSTAPAGASVAEPRW